MVLRSRRQLNLTFLIKSCFAYSFSVGYFKYLYIYMCVYVCIYVYTYVCVCMFIYIHICIYINGSGGLVAKLCLTHTTPWTIACQPSWLMRFSKQKHWSGLPFPSPIHIYTHTVGYILVVVKRLHFFPCSMSHLHHRILQILLVAQFSLSVVSDSL